MVYTDSVTYPMENDNWAKTVLIGGLLLLFSVLLVPVFLVYGYLVAVIRSTLTGEDAPPEFENWGELLVDGIQAWLIGLVYMLVPLIVAGVTVGGAILAFATGSEAGAAAGVAGLLGGLALTFVLAIVFGYFGAVAIVNFARESRFGAAFDVGTIVAVATDLEYAVPWVVSVLVFLVVGVVVGILGVIPVIGAILAAFPAFYAAVVAANLWGIGFDAATDHSPDRTVDEPDEVVV